MYEIFTESDYKEIKKAVYQRGKIKIEREYKKFIAEIKDRTATCDFYKKEHALKGDYILLFNWEYRPNNCSGGGWPICQYEFDKIFCDYKTFSKHVNKKNPHWKEDESVNGYKIKEVNGIGQLTLF